MHSSEAYAWAIYCAIVAGILANGPRAKVLGSARDKSFENNFGRGGIEIAQLAFHQLHRRAAQRPAISYSG